MPITTFIYLYLISVPTFVVIDYFWIGIIAKDFYQFQLAHIFGDFNLIAAIVLYLILLLGLTFFAIYPGVQNDSLRQAILYGALFGFFTYFTYDLTNQATIKDWPMIVTVVDIAWGTFVSGLVSGIVFYLYNRF
jgi:uncharacterized membrane protein